jgi:N-acylglucosamine 2-epimerase
MNDYPQLYRKELLENIIPFWLNHSKDEEYGGYFTCLNRKGEVFDTDKFIWLQGRQLWMFSMLYHEVEQKQEWLDMAKNGADFLEKYGRDNEGNWYFSLNRQGQALVQPYNIFSDCFVAMGFAALYKIVPDERYAKIAKDTFFNILKRRHNPKGIYSKTIPETRALKNFSLPMILCNLSMEMEHLLDEKIIEDLIEEVLHEVMEVFYQEDSGLILENVNPDGSFSDSFEGRVMNPGHVIEAMWFIMDLGNRKQDLPLINKAVEIALKSLEYGWDKEYGGVFYFLDIKGNPPQQLEWDQKLWWVHLEALVCMAKAYQLTGNKKAEHWFEKLHDYTWAHFKDDEFPEWYGYLNRSGEVLLPLKGGKWKGCFHVPRGLYQVMKTLEKHKEFKKNKIIQ